MRLCLFVLTLLPLISFGQDPTATSSDQQFAMIKGQGVPVCEAYLELLNQSSLEPTPFCGRPETGPVPFAPLERRDLGVDDILPLFNYVWEFLRFNDQHHVDKFFHPHADPSKQYGVDESKSYWSADVETADGITQIRDVLHRMSVWTYKTPVDIGNDGMPVRLLVWQGYGVPEWGGGKCGVVYGRDVSYNPQRVFVLSTDGKTIDEAQTRAIFGMPTKPSSKARDTAREPLSYPDPPAGAKPFKALADSIGIFGYDGRYYIQTENTPASHRAGPDPVQDEPPPVKVFLRERGHTSQVCAFRPQNVPKPWR